MWKISVDTKTLKKLICAELKEILKEENKTELTSLYIRAFLKITKRGYLADEEDGFSPFGIASRFFEQTKPYFSFTLDEESKKQTILARGGFSLVWDF